MNRVALYTRISTKDGRQDLDNQLNALREYASKMGWIITQEFSDQESGAKAEREGLKQMLAAATRRGFDVLLVFDLSRLTRGGPGTAFTIIDRLNRNGVKFWSFTQEHFRSSGPAGDLLIAIAAYIAQQERESMQQRIKAGIDRARRAGRTIGPPRSVIDVKRATELRNHGHSIREIAAILRCSKSLVERRLNGL